MFHNEMESRILWREFFENFSYKPNWEFAYDPKGSRVGCDDFGCGKVHITMRVPDSRRPLPEPLEHEMGVQRNIPLVPIQKTVLLERWSNEERAQEFLWFHIRDIEVHEIGEWFRYKGELPFDPHKEK